MRRLGLAALLLTIACTPLTPEEQASRRSEREEARIARSTVTVTRVAALGPYRAGTLESSEDERPFYFPASQACEALVQEGAQVRYRVQGTFGVLFDESQRCEPVGVGNLAYWRDQQGRRRSQYLIPRTQAEFRLIHESETNLLVRGRFPLTLELRWPEPMDAVAVLPPTPTCAAVAQAGVASLEYRTAGPDAFLLEGDAGTCPILGLALPLSLE